MYCSMYTDTILQHVKKMYSSETVLSRMQDLPSLRSYSQIKERAEYSLDKNIILFSYLVGLW